MDESFLAVRAAMSSVKTPGVRQGTRKRSPRRRSTWISSSPRRLHRARLPYTGARSTDYGSAFVRERSLPGRVYSFDTPPPAGCTSTSPPTTASVRTTWRSTTAEPALRCTSTSAGPHPQARFRDSRCGSTKMAIGIEGGFSVDDDAKYGRQDPRWSSCPRAIASRIQTEPSPSCRRADAETAAVSTSRRRWRRGRRSVARVNTRARWSRNPVRVARSHPIHPSDVRRERRRENLAQPQRRTRGQRSRTLGWERR